MINVIITIHVLIVLALIGVVLIQRSDGSALGLGGGSSGGFMTGSGAANVLTRTTSILAAAFFATSLGLAMFAQPAESQDELIRDLTGEQIEDPTTPATAEDLLRTLGGSADEAEDSGAADGEMTAPEPGPAEVAPAAGGAPVEPAPAGEEPAAASEGEGESAPDAGPAAETPAEAPSR